MGWDEKGFDVKAEFDRFELRFGKDAPLLNQDMNVDLNLSGDGSLQTYDSEKGSVRLKVKPARTHDTLLASARVEMKTEKKIQVLDGVCLEETISTCSGPCE